MPRDMFGDVVDPSIRVGGQKWYTVPLSILIHTVLIGGIIIIPLMAADALPEVPSMMAFVAAPPPPPPPRPRRRRPRLRLRSPSRRPTSIPTPRRSRRRRKSRLRAASTPASKAA